MGDKSGQSGRSDWKWPDRSDLNSSKARNQSSSDCPGKTATEEAASFAPRGMPRVSPREAGRTLARERDRRRPANRRRRGPPTGGAGPRVVQANAPRVPPPSPYAHPLNSVESYAASCRGPRECLLGADGSAFRRLAATSPRARAEAITVRASRAMSALSRLPARSRAQASTKLSRPRSCVSAPATSAARSSGHWPRNSCPRSKAPVLTRSEDGLGIGPSPPTRSPRATGNAFMAH